MAIPHRDPLPDCTGHNVHPCPKKATRRSHQEVEAGREAKAKAIEEQIQRLEEAKHLLAEVNASEDIENDAMDQNPQRLSTVNQKRKYTDSDDDGEVFDFKNVDKIRKHADSDDEGEVSDFKNVDRIRKHTDSDDDGEVFDFKDIDRMVDTSEDDEPVKQKNCECQSSAKGSEN